MLGADFETRCVVGVVAVDVIDVAIAVAAAADVVVDDVVVATTAAVVAIG